jgi:hypothetical protein
VRRNWRREGAGGVALPLRRPGAGGAETLPRAEIVGAAVAASSETEATGG